MCRLLKIYKEKSMWDIFKKYNYKTIMRIPSISKIVLNIGCGDFFFDLKKNETAFFDLSLISGQNPIYIKSKRFISGFKLKKGDKIAIKVTLRNKPMYNFIDKLVNIVLPRVVNFNGLSISSFDLFGNYSFGIKDQLVFPEIEYRDLNFLKGLNINFIINSFNNEESFFLLKSLNFPFNF